MEKKIEVIINLKKYQKVWKKQNINTHYLVQ